MNFLEKILYFLQTEMNEPKAFGWFHLICLFIVVIVLIYLYNIKNKYNEKQLKIVLGIYGVIALLLEVLKQLIWSFNYDALTNTVSWDYQWYAFPYQLCTIPIIVCISCLFLKKGLIRSSLLSFISYVTILGSIATMIMPDSCFTKSILVNVHTMWLHLGSFVISVYLVMTDEVKTNISYLKKAIIVFLLFLVSAEILNIAIYNFVDLNNETFNMFFISPYFTSTLPVFNTIQSTVPYLLFLLIYIVIITIGSFMIYLIFKLLKKRSRK